MHIMLLSFVPFGQQLGSMLTIASGRFPAQSIQCFVARSGNNPPSRRRRDPRSLPPYECDRERLLHSFLGERNIAEEASEHRHRAAILAAKDCCDFCAQQ
jgi:hypothetical protein